jgi:hypothetical protein
VAPLISKFKYRKRLPSNLASLPASVVPCFPIMYGPLSTVQGRNLSLRYVFRSSIPLLHVLVEDLTVVTSRSRFANLSCASSVCNSILYNTEGSITVQSHEYCRRYARDRTEILKINFRHQRRWCRETSIARRSFAASASSVPESSTLVTNVRAF